MNDSDSELISGIGKGDWDAFERLVVRHQNRLLNFAYRYLGDRFAAEDIVQETFFCVHRSAAAFAVRPGTRVSTWIFKIAYHLCLNELTRRKRVRRLVTEVRRSVEALEGSSGADAGRCLELSDAALAALNELPDNQRAALWLRVNEGLTYAEIAEVLGTTRSGVESLIFRARDTLRKKFRGDR